MQCKCANKLRIHSRIIAKSITARDSTSLDRWKEFHITIMSCVSLSSAPQTALVHFLCDYSRIRNLFANLPGMQRRMVHFQRIDWFGEHLQYCIRVTPAFDDPLPVPPLQKTLWYNWTNSNNSHTDSAGLENLRQFNEHCIVTKISNHIATRNRLGKECETTKAINRP